MAEKTLQPKLRFPGFEGEWEEKKLGEVSDILSGKRIPKGMTFSSQKTNRRYITVSDMGDLYVNPANLQYIDENVEKQIYKYKVLENDLIISVAGTIGKINIIDKLVSGENLTENCNRLTNFRDIHYKYLYYTMIGDTFQSIVNSTKTVGTQPKLALTRIRDFTAFFPSFQEQQKIASFLTTVDKRITLLTQKKEKLEQYKKGVMQKIFNREIRFKDENGNDFPEWEKVLFGDLTVKFSNKNKKLVNAPVYSVTNSNGFILQSDQFSHQVAGNDLTGYKIVKRGDFAYNPARINVGSIAYFRDEIGIISSLYVCFRTND
ncbi:MAG: restriction endonuclease subunit S, partial [Tannerellaceae bacterium]|nr:restriction endonuclease subunit S [Tannerellaceae bacterium]